MSPFSPKSLIPRIGPDGLVVLVIVLSFCGYLAWLGGPGPYIGGLIAILDLIAMMGVLFALRPDRLSEPRPGERPKRRPLPPRTERFMIWVNRPQISRAMHPDHGTGIGSLPCTRLL